jgi:hypothetical protein
VAVYLDVVYPAVLVACAVLFVAGGITMAVIRAHRILKWVVSGFYVVTAIEVVSLVVALVTGGAPVFMTVSYLFAAIALLPLLGIARLGEPDSADEPSKGTPSKNNDPNRPILQPDQIARVDGAAAMIIAIAAAVVAWRLATILGAVS